MARLYCYVPDDVAEALRLQADRAGMSVSRYLAELAEKAVTAHWPDGYFERVFGREDSDPIRCPNEGEFESRPKLE